MSTNLNDIFFDPLNTLDPLEALKKSIVDNQEKITQLNKDQLDRGLDSEGKDLGEYKNIRYKGRLRPVDLKNKNDFRSELYVKQDNVQSDIFSFDSKEAMLKKKYGKNIVGVPTDKVDDMIKIVESDFIDNYQKQLK